LTPKLSGKSNHNDLGMAPILRNDSQLSVLSMSSLQIGASPKDDGAHSATVSSLQKQLELQQHYNTLLERTVNSLRHSHNVYDLKKQWIEMKRELKPLPAFSSLTELQHRHYVERTEYLRQRQEMKRLQRKRRRNKLLAKKVKKAKMQLSLSPSPIKSIESAQTEWVKSSLHNLSVPVSQSGSDRSEDSEDVDIDDDMKIEDERMNGVLSSFEQKVLRRERYQELGKSLTDLNGRFGAIYSTPTMVDLTKRDIGTQHQTDIGRSLELRDLTMRCLDLSKQCEEIESNFQHKNVQNGQNTGRSNRNVDDLVAVGRVAIPGMDGPRLSSGKETRVCLNRTNFVKLQTYMNGLY